MLANRQALFAFIHVPKCAGTTIRSHFGNHDDFNFFFCGTKHHPRLGSYDGNHVPLTVLRDVFHNDFKYIASLDKFAIIRDPHERFRSCLAQRIRKFTDLDLRAMTRTALSDEVDKAINYMAGVDGMPKRSYAHFMRQSDFVELDGARFVENLYPIEETGALISEFRERLGVEIPNQAPRRKKTTDWRRTSRLEETIQAFGPVYRKLMPKSVVSATRQTLNRILASDTPPPILKGVFDTKSVRQFVETYYARDVALRAEVMRTLEAA